VSTAAWSVLTTGVCLRVRLTPRGGRDAIDGIDMLGDGQSVLKCRVRSAPTEGEANAALIAMLAKVLAVPKSAVRITHGLASRSKTLVIEGHGEELGQRLSKLTI
jgi:uncharacterized protein